MDSPGVIAAVALLVVLVIMLAELRISKGNEAMLRTSGALEPPDDVYATMQWAYPTAFVVMALEGAVLGPAPGVATVLGALLMAVSKALKYWAVASLGGRWTFRVLVVPGTSLVTHGPYAVVRHPNYIAVIGELVSMALLVGARVTGPVSILLFSLVLRRRIRVENEALRHFTCP